MDLTSNLAVQAIKTAPTASAGYASDSGSGNSVTVSGISGGAVNVTGQNNLTTLASLNRDVKTNTQIITNTDGSITQMNTAADSRGNNLAGTLTPIFDKEQVQRELAAQVQITQAFSAVAPKAVADYAGSKVKALKDTDPVEAAKWDEGGIYRIALHAALGGLLTGDISGIASAGTIASAAPLLNDLQQAVTQQLTQAGVSAETASTISQAVAELTSIGIGSAIGGQAGASTALVVDTNNRQLHQTEIDWFKRNAKQMAKDLNISESVAGARLASQTLRQVDATYAASHSGIDSVAAAYLNANSTYYNDGISAPSRLFVVGSNADFNNSQLYINTIPSNLAFYTAANNSNYHDALPTGGQMVSNFATGTTKTIANIPSAIGNTVITSLEGLYNLGVLSYDAVTGSRTGYQALPRVPHIAYNDQGEQIAGELGLTVVQAEGLIGLAGDGVSWAKGLLGGSEIKGANSTIAADTTASVNLADRVAQIRTDLNIGGGRNIGVAQYSIDGEIGELVGVSGQASRPGTVTAPAEQVFDTIQTGNNPRTLDSEYNVLSNLATKLNPSSQGVVNLYSELPVCASCNGVINQFQQRFPGVIVNVITGKP